MSCANLRLGFNNRTRYATLSADPTPQTPLDFMKNELASDLVVFDSVNSDGNIVITGTLSSPQNTQCIALPGVDKIGDVEIKLELYLAPDVNLDLANMEWTAVRRNSLGDYIPLGEWCAGVDPYGVPIPGDQGLLPSTFVHWLDESIYYDSFKLTIRKAAQATVALTGSQLRMLLLCDMLELKKNFSYGHSIRFLSPPEVVQTMGGSHVQPRRQRKGRRIELSLDQMPGGDYNALQQLETKLMGDSFILSAFPSHDDPWMFNNYNMLSRFGNDLGFSHDFIDIHSSNIVFLEV